MIPKPTIKIREFFESDRAILIICMSIALVFWLFTRLSQTYETNIDVPLVYNVPKGKILTVPPPSSLAITLKAEGWDLFYRYIYNAPNQLQLTLDTATQQVITYQDLQDKIKNHISSAITVESINPPEINFKLDKPSTKEVELLLAQKIRTIPQYQLAGKVQLLPNRITLSGPASALKDITDGRTKPLIIQDLNTDAFGSIDIKPFANTQIKYTPKTVNYNVNIEQFTEKKLQIPITIIQGQDSVISLTQVVNITAIIGISRFELLKASDFVVIANAKNINTSAASTLPLTLIRYPDYLKRSQIKLSSNHVGFLIYKKIESN